MALKLHIPPPLHHNPGSAWQRLASACLSVSDDIMAKRCCLGLWEQLGESRGSRPQIFQCLISENEESSLKSPTPSSGWTHPVFPERQLRGKVLLDSIRGIWCLHTLFISHRTRSSFRSSGILPTDVWTLCCIPRGPLRTYAVSQRRCKLFLNDNLPQTNRLKMTTGWYFDYPILLRICDCNEITETLT